MADPAIRVAIRKVLFDLPGMPDIILPNQAKRVNAPYLVWDDGPPPIVSRLTIGGEERFLHLPVVGLVVEHGSYTSAGDALLWEISQAYKVNTKIRIGSLIVGESLATPVPDGGDNQGGLFRRDMTLRIASYQEY